MTERYVHLVVAGSPPPAAGRLPERATWVCAADDEARRSARLLTDADVRVAAALGDPALTRRAVRSVLKDHPRGDVVLVADADCLVVATAELTDTAPSPPQPDVVTVRLASNAPALPLTLPVVLVAALVLSLLDVGQWLLTDRPGYVVGPAAIVAALVAAPRQTRDVGISLVVVVLLASFLDLGWLNFVPRLRE